MKTTKLNIELYKEDIQKSYARNTLGPTDKHALGMALCDIYYKEHPTQTRVPVMVILNWLLAESSILDNVEKAYLKNVIRPFKNNVVAIFKEDFYEEEYIGIAFKNQEEGLIFPTFKKGTMYKGMETGYQYTLEELGLD